MGKNHLRPNNVDRIADNRIAVDTLSNPSGACAYPVADANLSSSGPFISRRDIEHSSVIKQDQETAFPIMVPTFKESFVSFPSFES